MNEEEIKRRGPLRMRLVEGEPIRVGARELVPLVRVTGYVRRQAFVGSDRLSGHGWGFVRMHPVAVLERKDAAERSVPIRDRTAQTIGGLLLAALVVPLLAMLLGYLARRISD